MKQFGIIAWLILTFGMEVATASLWGQDCERIKKMAEQLGEELEREKKRYKDLKTVIEEKKRIYREVGGSERVSPYFPIQKFDESPPVYHDDRKWADLCPQWDGVDWGKRKDFREANLGKYRYLQRYLELEIDLLDSLISVISSLDTTVEAIPADAFTTNQPGDATLFPQPKLQAQRRIVSAKTYAFCRFDPRAVDLHITPHGSSGGFDFAELRSRLRAQGKTLLLAMNAGMYHPDKQPVGLLVLNGEERTPLNQRQGSGNFYLPPNGVFGVTRQGAAFILPTSDYADRYPDASALRLATQSGPMMLVDGQINRQFTQGSSNLHFRNAVGITREGEVIFALSEQRVNFYEFAQFLLQQGCTDALYLDGVVSRMYLPSINRTQDLNDSGHLGPILYLVE